MKILSSLFLALALSASACDDDDHDDDGHAEPIPECDEIGEACHDTPGAEAQACHEDAHDVWTKDQCIANRERCLALCTGPTFDGGAPDAGADAGAPDAAPSP